MPGVSVSAAIIECMFDTLPLDLAAFSDADDAAVVAAIEDWARVEAAAGARRLAAIAELVSRRCDKPDEPAHWACDFWDFAGAEVLDAPRKRRDQSEPKQPPSHIS
ncbi:MAG: hypothetical protein QOC62_128 [Mycobacterium sp.]|jgi:hypothetical protein|nr:hypothetical protein [Mycobacterium sp.]